ncbi:MAG: hypothetical protein AAFP98_02325 [Pseudomonadota bacterium]
MNDKFRITSEVIRVRSHFLVKLQDWHWAIAKHAIAAGEAEDNQTISMHLKAAQVDLSNISESGGLLGFPNLAAQADQVSHLIGLFLERCLEQPNCHKLLTDVIMEINNFVGTSKKLTDQPTVLQVIDLPFLTSEPSEVN